MTMKGKVSRLLLKLGLFTTLTLGACSSLTPGSDYLFYSCTFDKKAKAISIENCTSRTMFNQNDRIGVCAVDMTNSGEYNSQINVYAPNGETIISDNVPSRGGKYHCIADLSAVPLQKRYGCGVYKYEWKANGRRINRNNLIVCH